jgi:hypothetical protein
MAVPLRQLAKDEPDRSFRPSSGKSLVRGGGRQFANFTGRSGIIMENGGELESGRAFVGAPATMGHRIRFRIVLSTFCARGSRTD